MDKSKHKPMTHSQRVSFIRKMTDILSKEPYNYPREEANDIAILKADNLADRPLYPEYGDSVDGWVKWEAKKTMTKDEYEAEYGKKNESLSKSDDIYNGIKEWYVAEYPTDELGEEIDEDLCFADIVTVLNDGCEIYDFIPVDSIVRERIFKKISKILGVDYDVIYYTWLEPETYYIPFDGGLEPMGYTVYKRKKKPTHSDTDESFGKGRKDYMVRYIDPHEQTRYKSWLPVRGNSKRDAERTVRDMGIEGELEIYDEKSLRRNAHKLSDTSESVSKKNDYEQVVEVEDGVEELPESKGRGMIDVLGKPKKKK